MEADSGIVLEVYRDDKRNLGGGMVLMLMRAGILVGGVVVVAVGVMVKMEMRVVSFSEGRCLPMVEVQDVVVVGCGLVGGDASKFGFVAVVVVETVLGTSMLGVIAAVMMVCRCVNGELYSFWSLSRKFLEEKMSNVSGRLFDVVMQTDSLMACCLWEVTGSVENVVVVEMVVEVVESMVIAGSGVFLEVVMVQLTV